MEEKMQELLKQLEELKKEEKQVKNEEKQVKNEKTGFCLYDWRTAFINKVPQGLKDRKSFTLNVCKIDVRQSNVDNLINWLQRNGQEERADEVEANKDRIFDITIVADDGSTELFNSGILAFDKKNTLKELVVKSKDGYDYFINTMTWDAAAKELIFA